MRTAWDSICSVLVFAVFGLIKASGILAISTIAEAHQTAVCDIDFSATLWFSNFTKHMISTVVEAYRTVGSVTVGAHRSNQ
jgi:hypothetical protein